MAGVRRNKDLTPEERLQVALVPDLEHPHKLPKNWCWVRLGAVCSLENGEKHEYEKEKLVYLDAKTLRGSNDIKTRNSGILVDKGQKVILVDGENSGEIFVVPYRGYMGSTFRIVNILNNVDEMFIRYFIDQNRDKLRKNKIGSAIPHLNKDLFFELEFPLPPLHEQKRIVDRIESLFAKVDEVKQKAQDALDSFETRKAAILHKAFTGELTVQWRNECGGGMENWKKTVIGQCCKVGSGGTPNRQNPEYYQGTIPWIKTGEINWNWVDSSEETISEEGLKNSSAKLYPAGAVLVAMYGMGVTRGKAAILNISATTNQAVCVLQPDDSLLNQFLLYYFMYNYWNVREKAVGGNQLNLSATIIKRLEILLPPLEEQKEIIFILDTILQAEQQAKEAVEAVLGQIDHIKKSILARAFRGELGTNESSEECSIELLKRGFLEKMETKKVNLKHDPTPKKEVIFVPKSIMEVLSKGVSLTPESLKSETKLPIDDFYAQLKELIDNGSVIESREDGESHLEAANENR